jgi:hypothetical protein
MKERRARIMKRLLMEELERRTMLNGTEIAMASTGLTNNSYEDFYKAQVGTEIGGAAGVGMLAQALKAPRPGEFMTLPGTVQGASPDFFPAATTGVGQMVLTTGANTLGIGGFATPTAGPSRAGGTGNTNLMPPEAAATDQALLDLMDELPSLAANKQDQPPETRTASREQAGETEARAQREAEAQARRDEVLEAELAEVASH